MIPFYRLSGGGNDFLALAEPEALPGEAEIRAWCRRGLSLGADGVFALSREGEGLRMLHFNPDGGRAELCVNGSRCALQLAAHLGWSEVDQPVTLLTDAGALGGRVLDGRRVRVEVPAPSEGPRSLRLDGAAVAARFVVVGVPHLVLEAEDLETIPLATQGPLLRSHSALGSAGANVDWVRRAGRDRLALRTYERGVEAETLACGSGVLAAVAVFAPELSSPVEVETRGGAVFVVDFELDADGGVRAWSLTGDARLVAEGRIHPGASV